jgi:hypothetical protein
MCHLGDIVLHIPTGITGIIGAFGGPKKPSDITKDCVIIVSPVFKNIVGVFAMDKDYVRLWRKQRKNFVSLPELKYATDCIWVYKKDLEIISIAGIQEAIKKIKKEIGL